MGVDAAKMEKLIGDAAKIITPDDKMEMSNQSDVEWYVMRVTYQRELVARRKLEELGVLCYVPTQKVKKRKTGGGYLYREVARLHNYIFIHTSQEELKSIKAFHLPYLRYMMGVNEQGVVVKQFVPRKQMEDFMAICQSEGAKMLTTEIDLRAGDRVRILEGPLKGVEGVYIRTTARHEKRVVVRIEGVATVASASFPAKSVEKIAAPKPNV